MREFKHPLFDEIYFFENLVSSFLQAERMIKNKTAQGNFLVIAGKQSGGKGRNNNHWISPEGGIWITAALYGLSVASSLTVFTGICLHKAINSLFVDLQETLKIKWPNDIYLNERKLAGILSAFLENEKYHLLGIGLNSNNVEFPGELQNKAVALKEFMKHDVDNRLILEAFFKIFAAELPGFIENGIDLNYFNVHSLLKDKQITLDTDFDRFKGICKGLNKSGAILIELKPGMIQPFYSGSVVQWS